MSYHINVFYSDEDGGWIAYIPDLFACSAFGDTPEQALREALIAKEAWLEAARELGKPRRSAATPHPLPPGEGCAPKRAGEGLRLYQMRSIS